MSMSKEEFENILVQFVVVDLVPISFFSSSEAFQSLNGKIAKELSVSLDKDNIRKLIIEKAADLREKISDIVNNQFFFVKLDGVTRQRTSYLGINIQLPNKEGKKAVVFNLGVVEYKDHTSAGTVELLKSVLTSFGLSLDQVLAIVVDNASNMTKMVHLIQEEITNEDSDDEIQEDFEIKTTDDTITHHVRCGAHTLQLVVKDSLKIGSVPHLISKARVTVRKLRTPQMTYALQGRGLLMAILDVETRWGSTYTMLKRLLELKPFVLDYAAASSDLHLSAREWDQLEKICAVLEIPYAATVRIAEQLSPGDFVKEWTQVKRGISRLDGPIATEMLESMTKREQLLFSDILCAATCCDPRYRLLLTPEQKERGTMTLLRIALRMNAGQSSPKLSSSSGEVVDNSSVDLETELDLLAAAYNRNEPAISNDENNIKDAIEILMKSPRIKGNMPIFEAFENPTNCPPILKSTCILLSSLPTTQVSVERLFSGVKLLVSDLRTRLKPDLVDSIMFLRTNYLHV